jgi:hypothetical protein
MSVRVTAKQLGPMPSAFDEYERDVRRLLQTTPSMPASVLAERAGWTGSSSWFRKKVAQIEPEFVPKDPADRITYRPGDQAQCDLWFPPAEIPLGDGRVGSRRCWWSWCRALDSLPW